ncbi:MAG: DsbA family protein [Thermoleophilaceae bacterium]
MPSAEPERPVFYYDLTSPECWLMAEEVNAALPVVPVWQPLDVAAVRELAGGPTGGEETSDLAARRAGVAREAAARGLPAVRWPEPFPADGEAAMQVATFAQACGRAVAFSLAAFRQAFAAGRDLADPDTLLLAAAACELHPRAVLKGIETRGVKERVRRAHEQAARLGVGPVPCVRAGGALFTGESLLEHAAIAFAARGSSGDTPLSS